MDIKEEIIIELLKKVKVIPEDGLVFWKNKNKRAGSNCSNGYRHISITYKGSQEFILEHRLIFYYVYKFLPEQVDHINRIRNDNSINNLRAATNQTNQLNRVYINSKSGIRGVRQNSKSNKWQARIKFNKKTIHLGCFDKKEDAIKARKKAEEEYFKPLFV